MFEKMHFGLFKTRQEAEMADAVVGVEKGSGLVYRRRSEIGSGGRFLSNIIIK